ncbi:MAG: Spore germination protein B3 precursor [Firmicutes bacterium ADurb.Bin456]|nr:MAG: Spore germination protein B3 precursor [Firmicutes bacterium ADurb.Bin456]
MHSPFQNFFSHNQLILISEGLARNRDIEEFMDFFDRNQQFRRNNWVLITRSDPSSIMSLPGVTLSAPSQRIVNIIKQQDLSSFYPETRLGEFIKNLGCEGIDVFAAGIQIEPNEAEVREELARGSSENGSKEDQKTIGTLVKLGGTAVFRGSRLVGWLNERESRGLLWVRGKVKGGEITVPCNQEKTSGQDKSFSLEILRSSARIKPELSDGELSVTVKINADAVVHEIECMMEVDQPAFIRSLEEGLAGAIQVEVEAALAKAQQEYQSDIFGFGEALHKMNPALWGELRQEWPDIYRSLPVYLEVDARVTRTGLVTKPVQMGH